MNRQSTKSKGFTLVELLIVIGILGVLASAVVVVLNPAELLKQARDSQRLQDLASVNSALALYLTSTSSPAFSGDTNITQASGLCDEEAGTFTTNATTTVTGSGWVPVNFGSLTGGSPLSALPMDPTNSGDYAYCYADNTSEQWELSANLESTKFSANGTDDKEGNDGGDSTTIYEIGTLLTII